MKAWLVVLAWSLLLPAIAVAAGGADEDLWAKAPDDLKQHIESAHPAAYYVLASKLFQAGRRDEAVFWFYLGQLRYRIHLGARPTLEPSGDPALFASLSEVVGRPLNEYAFGDLPQLVKTVDQVLERDDTHPDGFTPKAQFATLHADVRAGLKRLQAYVTQNGAEIRKERSARGLENRN